MRITAAATVALAVALIGAAFSVVLLQREALTDNLDTTLDLRANDIALLLRQQTLPGDLVAGDDDAGIVQLLDRDGAVVVASANASGFRPMTLTLPPVGHSTHRQAALPFEGSPFRVLARTVDTPGGPRTIVVAGTLGDVRESQAALLNSFRAGIPLFLAVVALGIWLLVGRALAPVERIRREVASIGERDLSRRVPEPGGQDEIARLARTMNAMLDRLEAGQQRQDQFVADAAHELRSPLASMRTQIEAPAPGQPPGDLIAEVDRLHHLVDGLLTLAAADARGVPAVQRPVDLDDIVLDEVRRLPRGRPVAIDATGVSAAAVRADPEALRRVVRNLLDNAARHATSEVVLTLSEDAGAVTFAVADDGPGIPPEERERVFERFVRLDVPRSREQGGAGLGLAITHTLVEAMGGTVAVDPGHTAGARFVVRLPAASVSMPARPAASRK